MNRNMAGDERDAKLRELILYIAQRSAGDPFFGGIKLNKILFNADFTSYGRRREAVTGQEYQRLKNGPAPRRMKPILRDLEDSGDIVMEKVEIGRYTQDRVIPKREPDLSMLDKADLALVDESIALIRPMSGSYVSDLSHEFVGWKIVKEGETIPYNTVFLSNDPPTENEIKRGVELSNTL